MNNFNLLNIKWGPAALGTSGGTVTWSSDLSSGLDFDTGAHTAAEFDTALAAAFQAWEDVASIDFQFISSGTPDIMVAMGPLAGPTIGLASILPFSRPGVDGIQSVDITLDSLEFWAPFSQSPTETNFFAVAAHEIGHAIGLEHVNDPNQLMNAILTTDNLGGGDILGAQTIYGRDATDAPTPPGGGSATAGAGGVPAGADDGGGGGGAGIAVILAAIVALIASLFGGGAAGAVALAGTDGDDHDNDHGHDHGHGALGVADSYGDDLIAFLDISHFMGGGFDDNDHPITAAEVVWSEEEEAFVYSTG